MIKVESNRVEFLDFLRGIAIFLVFLSHTHHLINIDFIHQFGNLFSRGVQLFYLVSGFTIYMIYINKIKSSNELNKYLIKRFFRIMPLLFILIPIYYITFGLSLKYESTLPDWYHIASHYTLLFGFHQETMSSIIAPAWSIYDEFLFYIILGLILYKSNIKLYNTKIIFFLFSISIATFVIANLFYSNDMLFKTYLFFSPFIQMYILFVGGGILMLKNVIKISSVYFYLSLIILVSYSLFLNSTTLSVYLTVFLFSIIILYLSQNHVNYNKFFLFLGKISFSFYLIHYGIIKIFENNNLFELNNYLAVVIIFVITIVISSLAYKYVENIFINIGKNLIKNKYGK